MRSRQTSKPSPGCVGTAIVPSGATSYVGSTRSRSNSTDAGDMSAGSVNAGREDNARLAARPMPDSIIPPHHSGTPRSRQSSAMRSDSVIPPTRAGLRLTLRHASMSSARRTSSNDRSDSSRQTGVEIRRCSSACSSSWSHPSGCSMQASPYSSSCASCSTSSRV